MTFEEAVKKSIRAYYSEMNYENYETTRGKPIKYNKKYFDEKEEMLLGDMDVEDSEEEEVVDGE